MLTECGPGGFELQACAQLAHRTRLNRQLEQGPVRTWFEIVQASTTDEQWSAGMTDRSHQAQETVEPAASFEPYLQLVRSVLPRATSVALYDATGSLQWTTDAKIGRASCRERVETTRGAARAPENACQ